MVFGFNAVLHKFESELWQYYFSVPSDVTISLVDGKNRRVICKIVDLEFQCALLPDGNNGFYILLNKGRRKKLRLIQGEVFRAELRKDSSELGMPMSDELSTVFEQREQAAAIFNELTPGKKRSLIYWSDNVKSSEIKIRRAFVLMRHLIESNGQVDFKVLNVLIKIANQRQRAF